MDFFVGDNFKYLGAGAIIAAIIISICNVVLQAMKNRAERKLAKKRFKNDRNLAERKFEYERKIAEQKFHLDNKRNDHEKKQQLAEEVLALAYDIKDTINIIRSPFQFENEADGEDEKGRTMKEACTATLQRYESRKDKIGTFFSRKYRMKALFGGSSDDAFNIFYVQIGKVIQSAQILRSSKLNDLDGENLFKHENNL